jgi:hypothetical protein
MKTFCILVFAWLIALPSPAQQATFRVQGKVVDKTDNSALPGATVLFRSVKDPALSGPVLQMRPGFLL